MDKVPLGPRCRPVCREFVFDRERHGFLCRWGKHGEEMNQEFTSGDDFAQTFPGRRAIPAAITELMLALFGGQLGTFNDLLQHFRLLAANLHLAPSQPPVVVQRSAFQVLRPALTAQAHRLHHGLTGARPRKKKISIS